MDLSDIASIDFETGSRADLRKVGAAAYAEDPSTRVLCLSYWLPGKDVQSWREGQPFPQDLSDWVRAGKGVSGWNVLFEFYIWNVVLARQVTSQPIPRLRLAQLHDTMAIAAYNGLPLKLDTAAEALPKLGIRKDKVGHALMLRMSRPRTRGKKGNPDTWWHLDDPAKFDELVSYCAQDVRVERAILGTLIPLPPRERAIWLMDVTISIRGMLLDVTLANAMERLADIEAVKMDAAMVKLTGGTVPSTRAVGQLLAYAQSVEPRISSLAKDRLANWIDKLETSAPWETARWNLLDVLLLRQTAAKSSVAKVKAMKAFANRADNRMRGLYQYYGAFRTGRDAGRGPQIQNFPRGTVKNVVALIDFILAGGDADGIEMFFGVGVMEALSSALRGCVTVPKGKWFCSYDFAQIEARVTPWLAGDDALLDVFRQGRDIYVAAAAGIYGIVEGSVDAAQRQVGKVSVLALGFGGGVGAFQNMAKVYGLEIPDAQAEQIKTDWREANPKIVKFWWDLDKAALECVKTGHSRKVGFLRFHMVGDNLHMTLPAQRDLIYRDAEIGTNRFGRDCVTYMGVDQYTRKWERIETYGGKWCENCLAAGTKVLTDRGWVSIEGVTTQDKVWDGVAWVPHEGLVSQGVQRCINYNGVSMTPDHKVLTDDGWKAAETRPRPARQGLWLPDGSQLCGNQGAEERNPLGVQMLLRGDRHPQGGGADGHGEAGLRPKLPGVQTRPGSENQAKPRNVEAPSLHGVVFDARTLPGPGAARLEELWGPGDRSLPGMGSGLHGLLEGHGANVGAGAGTGQTGQCEGLLPGKLPMGSPPSEHEQPPEHAPGKYGSYFETDRHPETDALHPLVSRPVYDLLNAGPRSRFMVMGDDGPFIVSNCTQAVARDVMKAAALRINMLDGVDILGPVHDELLLELDSPDREAAIKKEMHRVPAWCSTLPVGADGYVGMRFKK